MSAGDYVVCLRDVESVRHRLRRRARIGGTMTPEPKRRFLLDRARQGDGKGYTDIAELGMRGEPECLDEQEWELHIDKRAKRDEEQRQKFEAASREQARRLLSFEERLVSAHEEARRRCVDVSSEVRLLKHMQSLGKSVRHLEKRLFMVERRVWRDAA